MLTHNLVNPSREDAVRLTRDEKIAMMWMYQVATVLCEAPKELQRRIGMIENGPERMRKLTEEVEKLIIDLRVTIPENQRMNLHRTAQDCEMRLAPKASPMKTTVVLQKEEYRQLVDAARVKCSDCAEDDTSCEKCGLFQLMTVINPLDDYHNSFLCPYNLREWKN